MTVHGMERSESAVRAIGVSHTYGGEVWALREVDLDLAPGVTALVGVNGAGKSTLMSVLAGAGRPTCGQVRLSGGDLYGHGRRSLLTSVALMPQALEMPASMTALEVVTAIGWVRGLTGREARSRAAEALETVDLADRQAERVKGLSGGMRRRIALAQALVARPAVLLLDEPSTGLDPLQRRRMVEVIQRLPGAVLLSSHVMEDVVEAADRVVVLHEGRVRYNGTVSGLQDLAPPGTPGHRSAEAGFLGVITAAGERPA